MKVILTCIGNYQEYIIDCIKQLQLWENTDIDVITNIEFFKNFLNINPPVNLINFNELKDYNYNAVSSLDRYFRNGFWFYASQRLFYLYSYIKKYKIKKCIHIENDVMVYENLNKLKFEKKVYVVYDSPKRVIPSILYIPNSKLFKPIIKNYNSSLNDMENLALFDLNPFPIIPILKDGVINKYNKKFPDFNAIFDGAAIGQYLAGIDPRNKEGDTRGFVNETCVIKYNQYSFIWLLNNNLARPYIICDDNTIVPILNLHMHSKNLKSALSNSINEPYTIITKEIISPNYNSYM